MNVLYGSLERPFNVFAAADGLYLGDGDGSLLYVVSSRIACKCDTAAAGAWQVVGARPADFPGSGELKRETIGTILSADNGAIGHAIIAPEADACTGVLVGRPGGTVSFHAEFGSRGRGVVPGVVVIAIVFLAGNEGGCNSQYK